MKSVTLRFAQFYFFAFLAMTAILIWINVGHHLSVKDTLFESFAHGAIWPITLIDLISIYT